MLETRTLNVARVALWKDRTKNELLVGQRREGSGNYPLRYEFPGGKHKPEDDASLEALRELWEEARAQAIREFCQKPLTYEYIMPEDAISTFRGWLIATTVIEATAFRPEYIRKSDEHEELRWVTIPQAYDLDLQPQAAFALPFLEEQQKRRQRTTTYSLPSGLKVVQNTR